MTADGAEPDYEKLAEIRYEIAQLGRKGKGSGPRRAACAQVTEAGPRSCD